MLCSTDGLVEYKKEFQEIIYKMATRNLTSRFVAIRQQGHKQKGDENHNEIMESVTDLYKNFGQNHQLMMGKIKEVRAIYDDAFYDEKPSEVKREVNLLNEIHVMYKQNEKAVEALNKLDKDQVIKNMAVRCLTQLKEAQKHIRELANRKKILDCDQDETDTFVPAPTSHLEALELLDADLRSESRSREIVKLAHDIEAQHQLFKDLSTLVDDQGAILNRIDYNIERSVTHVEKGTKELVKANEEQKKNTTGKTVVGLLGLVVVLSTILGIKKSH
jgi:hypothetical protein